MPTTFFALICVQKEIAKYNDKNIRYEYSGVYSKKKIHFNVIHFNVTLRLEVVHTTRCCRGSMLKRGVDKYCVGARLRCRYAFR